MLDFMTKTINNKFFQGRIYPSDYLTASQIINDFKRIWPFLVLEEILPLAINLIIGNFAKRLRKK